LGFAGLVGSRRTDVGLALFGVEPADSGEIILDNKAEKIRSPEQAMRLGIAYMSEDRRGIGLTMSMSITNNITLPMLRKYLSRFGLVRTRDEEKTADYYRERLSIRTPSITHRGIDVGAKAEVHHLINELAAQGLGIILISSDMPEVIAMSDRILVMREGKQMGIFDRESSSQEIILTAAMGQTNRETEAAV
jgi:rhamnose transport system ATP-binding protein